MEDSLTETKYNDPFSRLYLPPNLDSYLSPQLLRFKEENIDNKEVLELCDFLSNFRKDKTKGIYKGDVDSVRFYKFRNALYHELETIMSQISLYELPEDEAKASINKIYRWYKETTEKFYSLAIMKEKTCERQKIDYEYNIFDDVIKDSELDRQLKLIHRSDFVGHLDLKLFKLRKIKKVKENKYKLFTSDMNKKELRPFKNSFSKGTMYKSPNGNVYYQVNRKLSRNISCSDIQNYNSCDKKYTSFLNNDVMRINKDNPNLGSSYITNGVNNNRMNNINRSGFFLNNNTNPYTELKNSSTTDDYIKDYFSGSFEKTLLREKQKLICMKKNEEEIKHAVDQFAIHRSQYKGNLLKNYEIKRILELMGKELKEKGEVINTTEEVNTKINKNIVDKINKEEKEEEQDEQNKTSDLFNPVNNIRSFSKKNLHFKKVASSSKSVVKGLKNKPEVSLFDQLKKKYNFQKVITDKVKNASMNINDINQNPISSLNKGRSNFNTNNSKIINSNTLIIDQNKDEKKFDINIRCSRKGAIDRQLRNYSKGTLNYPNDGVAHQLSNDNIFKEQFTYRTVCQVPFEISNSISEQNKNLQHLSCNDIFNIKFLNQKEDKFKKMYIAPKTCCDEEYDYNTNKENKFVLKNQKNEYVKKNFRACSYNLLNLRKNIRQSYKNEMTGLRKSFDAKKCEDINSSALSKAFSIPNFENLYPENYLPRNGSCLLNKPVVYEIRERRVGRK